MTTPSPLALVTGASSGIGLELAKQLAHRGYDLVIAAEDAELATAEQSLHGLGVQVRAVRADLTDYDGVESVYAAVTEDGRPLDIAVLNAGVGVGGPFAENDLSDELALIQLNVTSTVHLAKRVAVDMVVRGQGRILFTSSVAARMPSPFQAVYGASKDFVQSFVRALRNELGPHGVSVTALLPGPTGTEFFRRAGMEHDTMMGAGPKDDPAQVAEQGIEALLAGKAQVLGGSLPSRVMGTVSAVIPDGVGAMMERLIAKPGTAFWRK